MNLSDLQRKDIVNMYNGKKLGRIVDALFRFLNFKEDIEITFQQIKKIGEDVILVELLEN